MASAALSVDTLSLSVPTQSAGTIPENSKPPFKSFLLLVDDTMSLSLPPLLPRRIKRKPIESLTASIVPHNEVNKLSFLSAFLKKLLSNSAINPFPFLKFEKAPEPFFLSLNRDAAAYSVRWREWTEINFLSAGRRG